MVDQGDIIKISGVKYPLLVVSNAAYNRGSHIVACPILDTDNGSALCFPISTEFVTGFVRCDNLHMFDMKARNYSSKGRVPLSKQMIIIDLIRSVFDYI